MCERYINWVPLSHPQLGTWSTALYPGKNPFPPLSHRPSQPLNSVLDEHKLSLYCYPIVARLQKSLPTQGHEDSLAGSILQALWAGLRRFSQQSTWNSLGLVCVSHVRE